MWLEILSISWLSVARKELNVAREVILVKRESWVWEGKVKLRKIS